MSNLNSYPGITGIGGNNNTNNNNNNEPKTQQNLTRGLLATRNKFFTYLVADFKKSGKQLIVRQQQQIWNYDGITMQIQGYYERRGSKIFNSFGKKHMVATRKDGSDATTKMINVVKRRFDKEKTDTNRSQRFQQLRNLLKDKTQEDYVAGGVYGQTRPKDENVANTILLLDDLGEMEVKAAFANAMKGMKLEPNDEKDEKEVTVDFNKGCVYNVVEGSKLDSTVYQKMVVSVFYDKKIYHIYHCARAEGKVSGPSGPFPNNNDNK